MGSGGDLPRWMQGTDSTAPATRSGTQKAKPAPAAAPVRRGPVNQATAAPRVSRPAAPPVAPAGSKPVRVLETVEKPKRERPAKGPSLFGNCMAMLGIGLGLLFILGSIAFFGGSLYLTDVLETISKRNYIGQTKRFDEYRDYFAKLSSNGFEVDESRPTIVQGRTTYSWSIRPRGSTDTRSFEWDHDLQTNTISPRTNGALLMDIHNNYMKVADAKAYEFFNPGDKLAQAIVEGSTAEISKILGEGWSDSAGEGGLKPPLAPLTDPKHPKRKNGGLALPGEDPEEEEAALEAAAAGNVAEGTGAGESTDVGGEAETTPGEDGSVEVGAGGEGEEEAGGEETGGDGGEAGGTEEGGEEAGETGGGEGEAPEEDGTGGDGNGDDSTPVG